MSWLFSRALVEEFLADDFLDGEQSAQWNATPMPQAFLWQGKTTAVWKPFRFGTTCKPLMAGLGAELLMSFLADFPAKPTAAHLEDALWRTISGRKCDGSWQMSLPGSYSPRTPLDAQSTERPMTSKRWVTKSDALSFPRKTWVLTTFGSATGYLHTPTHTANYACASMQKWPNCREFVRVFGKPDPTNHEWLMGWPIGWTDLRPLATDRFQQWRQRHSLNSPATSADPLCFAGSERATDAHWMPRQTTLSISSEADKEMR